MTISHDFGFIGWCNEGNHDKIWGYFYRSPPSTVLYSWMDKNQGRNVCVFWAARGKAMHFKPDVSGIELDRLVSSKLKKGYRSITKDKLEAIWPTFGEESSEKLLVEILMGKVK